MRLQLENGLCGLRTRMLFAWLRSDFTSVGGLLHLEGI